MVSWSAGKGKHGEAYKLIARFYLRSAFYGVVRICETQICLNLRFFFILYLCRRWQGSLLGPLMASSLYANHISWKVSYMILGGMAVLNLVLVFLAFRGVQFEEHAKSEEPNGLDERPPEQEKPDRQHGNFVQILKMKVTWILAMFLLFYVGVEVTIGGWGYTFLTMARYGDPVQMGRVSASNLGDQSNNISKIIHWYYFPPQVMSGYWVSVPWLLVQLSTL